MNAKRAGQVKAAFLLLVYFDCVATFIIMIWQYWHVIFLGIVQILKLNLKTVYTVHRGREKVRTRERERVQAGS